MLIDTHCHLTHERFEEDREEVLRRAYRAGVEAVIAVASDPEDAEAAVALARDLGRTSPDLPAVRATAGIHPHSASAASAEALGRVRDLLGLPEVVAVGECGLDFHYDFAPRERQEEAFRRQLELAAESGLPAVVHCREAERAMAPLVREAGEAGVRGVLHCYPGDLLLMETAVLAGWSVSFTGIVTFRTFEGEEAVRTVPADRYFLETDGPYLAPVPHRGRRNEPAFVAAVRDRVAEIRGEDPRSVAVDTGRNARAFFGLGKPA